jgi:hypothetical protein
LNPAIGCGSVLDCTFNRRSIRFIGTGGLRQTLPVLGVALLRRVPSHNRLHLRVGFQEPAVDALHQLHRYSTERGV